MQVFGLVKGSTLNHAVFIPIDLFKPISSNLIESVWITIWNPALPHQLKSFTPHLLALLHIWSILKVGSSLDCASILAPSDHFWDQFLVGLFFDIHFHRYVIGKKKKCQNWYKFACQTSKYWYQKNWGKQPCKEDMFFVVVVLKWPHL